MCNFFKIYMQNILEKTRSGPKKNFFFGQLIVNNILSFHDNTNFNDYHRNTRYQSAFKNMLCSFLFFLVESYTKSMFYIQNLVIKIVINFKLNINTRQISLNFELITSLLVFKHCFKQSTCEQYFVLFLSSAIIFEIFST